MAIRVLVISDYRDYHTVRPEANVFIGLAKLGLQIHIMTYKESQFTKEFEAVGIKVIDFHPQKKLDKLEIEKIRDYIIEEKIEILHLFNSKSIINGIKAAEELDVKVVLYRGFTGNIRWYDPTAYYKFLNRRVDKIVCNSKGVEDYINGNLFFDKSKTITINKGHDISWYNYEPIDIRKELGIPKDSFLLVNVANNRRMKGIPYLLKSMNLLPKDSPIHLLLVGRDMDSASNLKIVNQGHMKDNVHFLGFRKDALNIVAGSDVFVLSSLFGESITKSVIEAMSLGVAPIITDIPGNQELVVNGESGFVVKVKSPKEIAEAVIKLFINKDLCKKMGVNAKNRIDNQLNTNVTIAKTKELYENLVQKV